MAKEQITIKPITISGQDYKSCGNPGEVKAKFLKDLQSRILENEIYIWRDSRSEERRHKADAERQNELRLVYSHDQNLPDKGMRFGDLVGVYRDQTYSYKDLTYDIKLQIRCRLDKDETRPYFLLHMISALSDLEPGSSSVPSSIDDVLAHFMIYRFRDQLLDTCRLGSYKTYKKIEKNDENLRSSIDVERHLLLNTWPLQGKVAYNIHKRVTDNPFCHLILQTYRFIRQNYPELSESLFERGSEAEEFLRQLSLLAPSYLKESLYSVTRDNQQVISHPFYHPYEKLRKTCLDILHFMGLSIFGDDPNEVSGFFLYMPDLWECYLEKLFLQKLPGKWSVKAQKETRVYGTRENKFFTCTYPDYIFFKDGQPFAVLDAKFKPGWEYESGESGRRLSREHLDDYTKCVRDMVSCNVHKTGVLYPQLPSKKAGQTAQSAASGGLISPHAISPFNRTDMFYRCALVIPETKGSFSSWRQEMEQNENDFISKLVSECLNA